MAVDSDDLGCTNILTHRIETNEARPICQQAKRVPLPIEEKYKNCLEICCRRRLSHLRIALGLPYSTSKEERRKYTILRRLSKSE